MLSGRGNHPSSCCCLLMELADLTPEQWEALMRAVFPPEPAANRQGDFYTSPMGGTETDKTDQAAPAVT